MSKIKPLIAQIPGIHVVDTFLYSTNIVIAVVDSLSFMTSWKSSSFFPLSWSQFCGRVAATDQTSGEWRRWVSRYQASDGAGEATQCCGCREAVGATLHDERPSW